MLPIAIAEAQLPRKAAYNSETRAARVKGTVANMASPGAHRVDHMPSEAGDSIAGLRKAFDKLTLEDSGKFLDSKAELGSGEEVAPHVYCRVCRVVPLRRY